MIGLAVAACESNPTETEADVIVVGAGIAGLSAALEAGAAGVGVVVVEWSSVAGGHAVKAGGFALVDTPLQRNKGHADSPDLAFRDLMAWGENADADWVRQFVERSRAEVHDWLSGKGVRFNILIDTPEDSVPRFHFAGGTAVNVIVPLLREALTRDNIHWAMNSRAEELIAADDGVIVVRVRDSRTGDARLISAAAVVLATGGFQSNPDLVRRYWPATIDRPDKLLIGAGHRATGDGLRVGRSFGAAVTRIDDQVTFINGLPNPREPTRGLHVTNPASIWVNARGDRFVNERDTTRVTEAAVLGMSPQTHWMIFDARGRRKLQIRGAEWLNRRSIVTEILDNPRVAARAESIAELAAEAGLPPDRLRATVERYNDFIAAGRDEDFRRFGDADPITDSALQSSPYYALQLWPMTRKNLGGLAIDLEARALGAGGAPVPGLFAAGEVTGVAGINGRHGGSGTFLAPSGLMGR
ncbi:MAG: FAD-binding protein, partial [Gammaproteobacteria bacterium]